mmetsp:Transcript_73888/g.175871  ORF Transcript_73888/g.175871 Transcript_73888/m.175871 type:complete len:264 (+) Transcript_73888:132-923(+)
MVLPMGGGGMEGQQLPPPQALLVFKTPLTAVCAAYFVLVLFAIITQGPRALSLVLPELFVLIAAGFMVLRTESCLGQCLIPFFLFTGVAAVFGVINLLTALTAARTESHPGRGDMFSTSCPYDFPLKVLKNTTVYNATDSAPLVLGKDTEVLWHRDLCNFAWVASNWIIILATLLDCLATWLGYRMVKAVRQQGEGGQDMMMRPLQGSFGGPPPGGGRAGPPGGGPGGGGGGGGAPFRPPGQQPAQGQGFQTFSGRGQTVGSN